MDKDYFDPTRYQVVDRQTGEEVPIQIFIDQSQVDYWEKAYAKTIAEYLNIAGNAAAEVLAHFLKIKDSKNQIHGTHREISAKLNVAKATVSTVIKKLQKAHMLHMLRNGCYMLSPHVIRHGSRTQGAMVLRLWQQSEPVED